LYSQLAGSRLDARLVGRRLRQPPARVPLL